MLSRIMSTLDDPQPSSVRGSVDTPPARRRGRPRSAAVDRAILDATLRLLAIDGYQGLTFTAVAAEAQVGRPALYRRYAGKAQLVAAAFLHASAIEEETLPSTTRDALLAFVSAPAAALSAPGAMTVLGSLMAEERRDPALVRTFRELIFQPRRELARSLLARGIAQGEIRPDIDPEAVLDLLFGALLSRAMSGAQLSRDWLDGVVTALWPAIAAAPASARD
jgi:AcrR family transcriptional regulator